MSAGRKPVELLLILVVSVLLFQNCLTITKGVSQRIPVTSNLIGAKVFVDGKEIGATPIYVVLKKDRDHVIRVEKQGYGPVTLIMNREAPAAWSSRVAAYDTLAFFPIGFLLAGGISSLFFDMGVHGSAGPYVIGALGGMGLTLAAISTDKGSDARYRFSPAELKVSLAKTGTHAHEVYVALTPERLNGVHWIRISYSDNDKVQ